MTYQTIVFDRTDGIGTLTLNRPAVLNAMNRQMHQEMKTVLDEVKADDRIRVLIITGAGDKAFCAGRDLKEYSEAKTTPIEVWAGQMGQSGISGVAGMTKPVIAAINGFAIGGGLELTLTCDIRIASEQATFGLYEIRRGFFPGGGATWRLAPLVGKGWAMEMILSGEPIDARTAERIGLVNRIVPHQSLMPSVRELAEKIAHHSPASILLAKQAINQAWSAYEAAGANIGMALRALAETNPDRLSATRAFLEKKER